MMTEPVIKGDCLEVLNNWPDNSIDLVYLDPPFFTQKTHVLKTRDLTEEYQFDDLWDDIQHYLQFLRERLTPIKRVMKDRASIFFHCDKTASHHIRLLLDEIFGEERFLSEIIWTYRRWSNSQKTLLGAHQTIFMYSKTGDYTFNTIMQDYSQTTNLDQILQKRERDADNKTVYARHENGEVMLNGPKEGVPLSDVWEIPYLNPKAKERVGYPTQKPLLLLERIIQLASDSGDVVLDPFCGSGTTLVAAALLNRRYVGIDKSEKAIELTKVRLDNPIKSESNLLKQGRAAYDNTPPEIKEILSQLPVKIVQRNAGIDALHNEFIGGKPVLIRVQRHGESIVQAATKLAAAGHKKQAHVMILIQTEDSQEETFINVMPEDVTIVQVTHLSLEEAIKSVVSKNS
jgi:site-specific DNA-methyltransferase (adenine-specific)